MSKKTSADQKMRKLKYCLKTVQPFISTTLKVLHRKIILSFGVSIMPSTMEIRFLAASPGCSCVINKQF